MPMNKFVCKCIYIYLHMYKNMYFLAIYAVNISDLSLNVLLRAKAGKGRAGTSAGPWWARMGWSMPLLLLTAAAVSVPTVMSPACLAFRFCLSPIMMMLGLGRINDV